MRSQICVLVGWDIKCFETLLLTVKSTKSNSLKRPKRQWSYGMVLSGEIVILLPGGFYQGESRHRIAGTTGPIRLILLDRRDTRRPAPILEARSLAFGVTASAAISFALFLQSFAEVTSSLSSILQVLRTTNVGAKRRSWDVLVPNVEITRAVARSVETSGRKAMDIPAAKIA